MYGPWPIRFSAHWCADYSKYRGFLAGGISIASFLLPFFGTQLRRQNLISHPHNTASYTGYLKDFKNIYLQPYDFFPLLHEVFPLTNFQLRKKYFKNQLSLTQLNSIFMAYRQNMKTESIRKLSNFNFQWTKPCTRIITRNIFHTFRGL